MRHIILRSGLGAALALNALGSSLSGAATFQPTPISPELGLDVLDQSVSESRLERSLLAAPYAVTALGTVDVYDVFPYVESRFFIVVSDPAWNRIVATETGSGTLSAFDGMGTEIGTLASPHGLAVDRAGWLYVCDTDNDRLVVLEPKIEYNRITLLPRASVEGLSRPLDVASHDPGTPFDASDDRLYVVEAGANRVTRLDRAAQGGFVATESIGGLGTGPGRFAGPTAITTSTAGGTAQIYVAEAHTGCIVRLEDGSEGMRWLESRPVGLGRITGLEADRHGNLYATAPDAGCVSKLTANLVPLATLSDLQAPKDFFIPQVRTEDHRTGRVAWSGHSTGVLVERWDRGSGLRLFDLGVEVLDLRATSERDRIDTQFRITDPANVTIRLLDPHTDGVLAERAAGLLSAGEATADLSIGDLVQDVSSGDYLVEVVAHPERSSTGSGAIARARTPVTLENGMSGGGLAFSGTHPNPFVTGTDFRLSLPANATGAVEVDLFDPSGRRIRSLAVPAIAGGVSLRWDGRDESGHDPGSGVYLYRVRLGEWERSGKVVKLR